MKAAKQITGEDIRQLRNRLYYTQSQLAGLLGIDRTVISKLETGIRAEVRGPLAILFWKYVADLRAGRSLPPTTRKNKFPVRDERTKKFAAAQRRRRLAERKAEAKTT